MKSSRIIHLPDYHKSNQYQGLLLEGLKNIGFDVGYGLRKVYFSNIDLSILFNVIKKNNINVFHLHWLHPFLLHEKKIIMLFRGFLFVLQLIIIKIFGIKLVWTVHNLKNHENRFVETEIFFTRIIAKLANAVIAHCEASKREIITAFNIKTDKVDVIPHGNYLDVYKNNLTRQESRKKFNFDDEDFVFFFLGLIRPYKGILDLIESFQKINDMTVKLIIAGRLGSPDLKDTLLCMAASNKNIFLDLHHDAYRSLGFPKPRPFQESPRS